MRRKLFSVAVSYLGGIAACSICMNSKSIFLVAVALFAAYISIKAFGAERSCLYASMVGAAVFALYTVSFESGVWHEYVGREVTVSGQICEAQRNRSGENEYICLIKSIDGVYDKSLVKSRILIEDKEKQITFSASAGATVRFRCTLEKPESAANPGMFDYRRYLYSKGIVFCSEDISLEALTASKNPYFRIISWIYEERELFLGSLDTGNARMFTESVVFGNSKALPEDIYYAFQMNGTAHVLAVSGLHIGVLYSCFIFFKRKTGFKILTPAFVLFLFIYGTCAMWAVSVKRAVMLILMKLVAEYADRPFDLITGTSFAALVLCIVNPYEIFSVGFQLSFLAVAILAAVPRAAERINLRGINGAVIIQILIAPYICFVFNYFSVAGFLANIPVIFVISLIVPLGIVYFVFYAVAGAELELVERCIAGLSEITVQINELFYASGKTSFDVVSADVSLIVTFYIVLFFASSEDFTIDCLRKRFFRMTSKLLAVFLCISILWIYNSGMLYSFSPNEKAPQGIFRKADFVFADFRGSECMHIRFKDADVLIDGGGRNDFNAGKRTIKQYLMKNGVSNIQAAIASVPDQRHYLGLFQLSRCFDVNNLIVWAGAGERIEISETEYVEVMWPEKINIENPASPDNRRVLKVCKNGVICIVYGGLDSKNEKRFLEKYCGTGQLSCDIVKISVPEHGNVSSGLFLDAAEPEAVIISAGGFDADRCDEMIENIAEKDIMVYRTDLLGAVGIIADKENFRVCMQQKNMLLKYSMKN